jgi:hypothetical protein
MARAKPKGGRAKPKPTLLNKERKSAAEEFYPHLKSALAIAGPVGLAMSKAIKGRGRR